MPSDTATTSGASYATADDNLQSRPGHVAIDIPEADERPDDTASTSGTSYATANDSLQGRPGHVTVDIPEADISDALYPPADAGAAAQPAAADNAGANQPSGKFRPEANLPARIKRLITNTSVEESRVLGQRTSSDYGYCISWCERCYRVRYWEGVNLCGDEAKRWHGDTCTDAQKPIHMSRTNKFT